MLGILATGNRSYQDFASRPLLSLGGLAKGAVRSRGVLADGWEDKTPNNVAERDVWAFSIVGDDESRVANPFSYRTESEVWRFAQLRCFPSIYLG